MSRRRQGRDGDARVKPKPATLLPLIRDGLFIVVALIVGVWYAATYAQQTLIQASHWQQRAAACEAKR